MLVTVPAATIEEAAADTQTEERCDYDPVSNQPYNCRTVNVAHTHPCPTGEHDHGGHGCHLAIEMHCPAGQHSHALGTCHSASQLHCGNGEHYRGSYGCHSKTPMYHHCSSGTHAHHSHQSCHANTATGHHCYSGAHSHGTTSCHTSTPSDHHCSSSEHKHGSYGCHSRTPTYHRCSSGTHAHHSHQSCHANTATGHHCYSGAHSHGTDPDDGTCLSGTFVSGDCQPRPVDSTPNACDAWVTATRDGLNNLNADGSYNVTPAPDDCEISTQDVIDGLGDFFASMGDRRIENSEARRQAYAELREAIRDAWDYEIPALSELNDNLDTTVDVATCAGLGYVFVKSKGKAATAPGWTQAVAALGCANYIAGITIDDSDPDDSDGGSDSDGSSDISGNDDAVTSTGNYCSAWSSFAAYGLPNLGKVDLYVNGVSTIQYQGSRQWATARCAAALAAVD